MMSGAVNIVPSRARRVVRWLCRRVLPPLAYPVIRGPLRGARFILGAAAGEGGGASVYVNRVEPAQTEALLRLLKPGQIFFDVGANVGYYTLLASRVVGPSGRVLAFEPVPRNVSYLHRHVALNGADNVSLIPIACSDRSALEAFVAGPNWATGRLMDPQPRPPEGRVEYAVTVAIDEIVRKSGLVPDVLKIDVEGAEERVLKGAEKTLTTARPSVFLSVHSEALRSACTAYLVGLGYAEPALCAEPEGDTELLFMPPARPRTDGSATRGE
jgi:FkbM family methyltransferase